MLRFPPIVRAIAAQAATLAVLASVRMLIPVHTPLLLWISLQAVGAAALGRHWSLGHYWMLFQIGLPIAIAVQMGHAAAFWVYPSLLAVLLLVFGGGITSRVPLYNSGFPAWVALAEYVAENENVSFIDLGAGLGGPLAHLARNRPRASLLGVEASPLVWLIGWLRTASYRPRCVFRLGSIWKTDLHSADVVYAFLSPAPMPALWAKVRREMRPGSIFISHSFEVPGVAPSKRLPLPGRKGAALLVYEIPD
jgi:SAM-dependent methyltransferase